MNKLNLTIITPFAKYLQTEADEIIFYSDEFSFGITYNHYPMISDISISWLIISNDNNKKYYAVGGGVFKIKEKGEVILLLDSIEAEEEIDGERANHAKKRAEERIAKIKENSEIDEQRARLALARAINRLKLLDRDNL